MLPPALSVHMCVVRSGKAHFVKAMWEVLEITRTKSKFQLFSFLAKQHLKLLYITEFEFSFKMHIDGKESPKHTSLHSKKVQLPRSNYSCQIAVLFFRFLSKYSLSNYRQTPLYIFSSFKKWDTNMNRFCG